MAAPYVALHDLSRLRSQLVVNTQNVLRASLFCNHLVGKGKIVASSIMRHCSYSIKLYSCLRIVKAPRTRSMLRGARDVGGGGAASGGVD